MAGNKDRQKKRRHSADFGSARSSSFDSQDYAELKDSELIKKALELEQRCDEAIEDSTIYFFNPLEDKAAIYLDHAKTANLKNIKISEALKRLQKEKEKFAAAADEKKDGASEDKKSPKKETILLQANNIILNIDAKIRALGKSIELNKKLAEAATSLKAIEAENKTISANLEQQSKATSVEQKHLDDAKKTSEQIKTLQKKIETSLADLGKRSSDHTSQKTEIEQLKKSLSLQQKTTADLSAKTESLIRKITPEYKKNTDEKKQAELKTALPPPPSVTPEEFKALKKQVETLAGKIDANASALSGDLAKLQSDLKALPPAPDEKKLNELKQQVETLSTQHRDYERQKNRYTPEQRVEKQQVLTRVETKIIEFKTNVEKLEAEEKKLVAEKNKIEQRRPEIEKEKEAQQKSTVLKSAGASTGAIGLAVVIGIALSFIAALVIGIGALATIAALAYKAYSAVPPELATLAETTSKLGTVSDNLAKAREHLADHQKQRETLQNELDDKQPTTAPSFAQNAPQPTGTHMPQPSVPATGVSTS